MPAAATACRHHCAVDNSRDYTLLDCGRGRRLEQFGELVLDRPAPMADEPNRAPGIWGGATAYRAGRGWASADGGRPDPVASEVEIAGVVMGVELGAGGQVGVFPEHAANAGWVRDAVVTRSSTDRSSGPAILNLFAHTGLLTLVAGRAGARVTHLDASRPAVGTARANADRSDLAGAPIRWIVDDAVAFTRREARRGRVYAGFVIDPPTYGHGARGVRGAWQFDGHIEELLVICREVAAPDAFWLLSTHSPGWDPDRLAALLAAQAGAPAQSVEGRPLELIAESGARLHLGSAALLDPRTANPR